MTNQSPSVPYAKVWSRIYAFCLDSMIVFFAIWTFLKLLPETRSLPLDKYFLAWGSIGWWALFLIYRGVFSSRLFEGQTFGKAVVGLSVRDAKGKSLSLKLAFLREGALTLCLLCGLWVGVYLGALGYVIAFLIPLVALLLNRRTVQSLHDLAASTFVLQPEVSLPLRRAAKTFLVLLCATGGVAITKTVIQEKNAPVLAEDSIHSLSNHELLALAKSGDKKAEMELAVRDLGSRDPQKARAAFTKISLGAEAGDPEAQITLAAVDLALSQRAPGLRSEAMLWIGKAAGQGFARAELMLGMILLSGQYGMPKDISEGATWLRKAASNGLPEAKVALYRVHEKYPDLVRLADIDEPSLSLRTMITAMDIANHLRNYFTHSSH